jgi:coenzyme F420-reducing hydrogenase delta subunit
MPKRASNDTEKQPRIAGFVCNWGAYAAVEMAGVNGIAYPADVRLVRLACLGRLHLGLLLKAFELGADGVVLLGCRAEHCHYESGMARAKEVFAQAREVLGLLGMERQRLELYEVPVGDGEFVAKKLSEFDKRVRRLITSARPELRRTARI